MQPLAQQYRLGLIVDQLGVAQNIAREDLRIKRAEFIPDVDLHFRHAHPATADQLPEHIALAGITLTWEIQPTAPRENSMVPG